MQNISYKVVWTARAKGSFSREADFIYKKWDKKVVERFFNRTVELIDAIRYNPLLFEAYKNDINIRRGWIHENVTMFYRIKKEAKSIEILLFWNSLRDPRKLKL